MTARALLPILWVVLVLPSGNIARFDGLPLDTGPELIGLLLLLPLTVSRALRRHYRRVISARSLATPAILVALGLVAVGGKVALLASGSDTGFLGCYRSTVMSPPAGSCERSFTNPWFRYSVTRIDSAIDFEPDTWNLSFLNSRRFAFYGLSPLGRPFRDRIPMEVAWQGAVERSEPWVARVTYVGEATLRLRGAGPSGADSVTRLPPHYGSSIEADVPIPAGPHLVELTYRFDDGARWPDPRPAGPWATLRLERGDGRAGQDPVRLVRTAPLPTAWRALGMAVDSATVILGATVALGYAVLLRRDWWLIALVAAWGLVVSHLAPAAVGLPITFGVLLATLGVALALSGRPWRRRLVLAFLGMAYLNLCLVLSSTSQLDKVVYREGPSDSLVYESHARTILETWSPEGGEPVFRQQPGFRYWRFLERLVLGDGDPFALIVGLTLLQWGYLWAIARLWPRPAPGWSRTLPFALGSGLILGLATSMPVVSFVEAPMSEYPTWVLLPLSFTLLFGTRSPRRRVWGGILGGVAALCRLNHVPAFLGYLAVFARQRWRGSPRAVALTVGLAVALLTLPALHNRYYGGSTVTTRRVLSINRADLVISPARLAQLPRDSGVIRDLRDQIRRMLYLHHSPTAPPWLEPFSRLTMWGLQWLWVGTAAVVLPRRRLAAGAKALLLAPLLYFLVHLVYAVDIYFPRHVIAGHLALGLSVLYTAGRGWSPASKAPAAQASSSEL